MSQCHLSSCQLRRKWKCLAFLEVLMTQKLTTDYLFSINIENCQHLLYYVKPVTFWSKCTHFHKPLISALDSQPINWVWHFIIETVDDKIWFWVDLNSWHSPQDWILYQNPVSVTNCFRKCNCAGMCQCVRRPPVSAVAGFLRWWAAQWSQVTTGSRGLSLVQRSQHGASLVTSHHQRTKTSLTPADGLILWF